MRRITTWVLSTISALVLLFNYHTSTSSAGTTSIAAGVDGANGANGANGATGSADGSGDASTDPAPTTSDPTPSPSSSSVSPSSTPSPSGGTSSSSSTKTVQGQTVQTRYGPVQVQITVKGGKVTAAKVLQVPWNSGRDQEINSYAVPILNQETVAAQSAQIDMVSGATFTSEGYQQSLQSALDEAHL